MCDYLEDEICFISLEDRKCAFCSVFLDLNNCHDTVHDGWLCHECWRLRYCHYCGHRKHYKNKPTYSTLFCNNCGDQGIEEDDEWYETVFFPESNPEMYKTLQKFLDNIWKCKVCGVNYNKSSSQPEVCDNCAKFNHWVLEQS